MLDDKNKKRKPPTVKRPEQPPVQIQTVTGVDDTFESVPPTVSKPIPTPPPVLPAGTVSNERMPPTVSRPRMVQDMPVSEDIPMRDRAVNGAPVNQNIPAIGPTIQAQRAAAEEEVRRLQQPVTESKNSRWDSALAAIGRALETFSPQYGAINSLQQLFARAGAIPGAMIGGAINDTWDENAQRERDLGVAQNQLNSLNAQGERDFAEEYKRKQMQNIDFDNVLRQGELAERVRSNQEREANQRTNQEIKKWQNEANVAMAQWRGRTSFNENDPKLKELVGKMRQLGIPITEKDAKHNIKYAQDAETGAWSLIVTDPTTGKVVRAEQIQDTKTGKPLITTSSAKVMSEAAAERQDTQNDFNAGQKALDRATEQQRDAARATREHFADLRKQAADQGLPFTEPTDAEIKAKYESELKLRK